MGQNEPAFMLVVRSGEHTGLRVPVIDAMVIGRGEECTLRLQDRKMSRRHARIRTKRSKLIIENLRSNDGTFVNGKRVRRKQSLSVGDLVLLGRTELEVLDSQAAQAHEEREVAGSGVANRVLALVDFAPAKVEAMPTQEFMTALGLPPEVTPVAGEQVPAALEGLLGEMLNFAVVYNVARALQTAKDVPELLRTTLGFIFKVTAAERCYILLIDPKSGELVPSLARHRDPEAGRIPLRLSGAVIERVLAEKSALIWSDGAGQDGLGKEETPSDDFSDRSVLCVPILDGWEPLGVIHLDRETGGGVFTRQELEVMTVIASLLGVRIQNLRLFEQQARTVRALHEAQSELVRQERMALLGRLTSGLAHEIGNLMTPFTLAKVLVTEQPTGEDLVDIASMMLEAQQRISTLLSEVRSLAKGESHDLEPSQQDLGATIESVVRFSRHDRLVKQHQFELQQDPVPPFLYDEGRVKQVLLNLIQNAAEAMEQPGAIRLRLSMTDDEPAMARVDVIDEGRGISHDVLAHIWEPFFSTKQGRGMGLGLDISRNIIERDGGRIECESGAGGGTRMSVFLPIRTE